jgi:hypothetical protein
MSSWRLPLLEQRALDVLAGLALVLALILAQRLAQSGSRKKPSSTLPSDAQ